VFVSQCRYKVTEVSSRWNDQADFKCAGLLVIRDTNVWTRSKGLFIILHASTTRFIYSINYLFFTFFVSKHTCILLLFIYTEFSYKWIFDSACWLLLKSRNPRDEWWIVLSSHLFILNEFHFVSWFSPVGNIIIRSFLATEF